MKKKTQRVLVAVADGVEAVETIAPIDVLRRAGLDVVIGSVGDLQVTMAYDMKLMADKKIADCSHEEFALIVIPGGNVGAEHMRNSKDLTAMLKKQKETGRWLAAICASPVMVFDYHGLLDGVKTTCYPTMTSMIKNPDQSSINQKVVVDDKAHCVTSQGPGTSLLFAITLVEVLLGKDAAQQRAKDMLIDY